MRGWRRWLLLLAASVLLAGLAGLGLERGWWRFNSPDTARFPVWGIDVSHHQGPVEWASVATEPHLAFAYVKATEGGDWVDRRFEENWRGARAAGLRVGAYHFFTFCRPAQQQAAHFLSVVPPETGTLPPAVDVEFGGNCRNVPAHDVVLRELALFLHLVQKAWGRRPVLYVTPEAYRAFLQEGALDAPLWIRDVLREPRLPAPHTWAFWQFHHRGRVRGIPSPVDLNVFQGDRAALERL
jgi:lysozyme